MGLIAHAFVKPPEDDETPRLCAHVTRKTVRLKNGASYTVTTPCLHPQEGHNAR